MSAETGSGATWQNNPLAALVRGLATPEAQAALAWAEAQDAEVDKICARVGAEIMDELSREASAHAKGREEGLVAGFADCEALVVAMLTALADAEHAKAGLSATFSERKGNEHGHWANALRSAALAVQLGQHRTEAYDADALATAHRKAAQPNLAAKGSRARMLKLTPERQREIAKMASDAALTARRARAKGE